MKFEQGDSGDESETETPRGISMIRETISMSQQAWDLHQECNERMHECGLVLQAQGYQKEGKQSKSTCKRT